MKQVLAMAVFAALWLGGLTTAEGCWLRDLFTGGRQTTYMLPVAAAPAPAAAAYTTNYPPTWQQVLYAPQTQYQTLWRPYPITTYNPVAVNGLYPTASYGWQASRVPTVALQPVVTAPTALPATTAVPAASVAPSLSPPCSCSGADTTAYYGSTSAWSPVTPAASSCDCTVPGSTCAAPITTTGYAPSYSSGDAGATDWTPVTQSAEPATGYAPMSSAASTTLRPWQQATGSSASGASDWMTIEEYRRQHEAAKAANGDSSGAAADTVPQLPRALDTQRPELDVDLGAPWRAYDNQSRQPGDGVSSNPVDRGSRYLPPAGKQQLLPFNRPIPDPDRQGAGWDFDDKLQLQQRESRSAQATRRWRAVPVRTVSRPHASSSNLDRLLDPPQRRHPAREEGGWHSVPK